jgi:hypothetical protein
VRKLLLTFLVVGLALLPLALLAQDEPEVGAEADISPPPEPPAPPTNLTVEDAPNDAGRAVALNWELSADDGAGRNNVIGYKLYRGITESARDSLFEIAAEKGDTAAWVERYSDSLFVGVSGVLLS